MKNEVVYILFRAAVILGILELVLTLIVYGVAAFLFRIREDISNHGVIDD